MIEAAYQFSKFLKLPSTYICYLRKGEGAPILLLHGVPLSLLTWRNNIDYLSQRSTVLAIDMMGYGMSGKPPGSYGTENHARVISELLDALDLPQVSLVGSSYGCAVAIEFARAHPERVDKLVLINSVGYPGGPHSLERLLRIKILAAFLHPTLRTRLVGKRLLASGLRKSYANPRLASKELVEAYFTLLRRDSGEAAFFATLEQFQEEKVAQQFAGISQETLIIWGTQDHVLPVANAPLIHRQIRGSRLEIIPGCGHLPHEEKPELVNELIAQFLNAPLTVTPGATAESQAAYA